MLTRHRCVFSCGLFLAAFAGCGTDVQQAGNGPQNNTGGSVGSGGTPVDVPDTGTTGGGGAASGTGGASNGDGGTPITGDDGGTTEPTDAALPPLGDAGALGKMVGLWDFAGLVRIRDQASSGALKPAFDAVIKSADEALGVGPFSVMDKTKTPPSNDKHDYMTLGRYWWPNPADPTGPYIQKDGESNPEYATSAYDYTAMLTMTDSVTALGLAYFLTGNEKYAAKAHDLLNAWYITAATRMNPNFNYAQSVPGVADGRKEGVIDGLQMAQMLDGVELLRAAGGLSQADYDGLITWFSSMLTWLTTNAPLALQEKAATNNHGTWYDVQTSRYAVFVGKPEIAVQIANDAKQQRIAKQVLPSGQQPEETKRTNGYFYSLYNLTGLFDLATLAGGVGVDLFHYQTTDARSIQKALDFMAPYADATKVWPPPGVTSTQITQPPPREMLIPLLRRGSAAYNAMSYEQTLEMYFAADLPADETELVYPK
jgi:hypothetical protein